MNEQSELRYSRQTVLPQIGAAGQEKLAGARVLIIGLGGIGSPAALYLANAGVGRLALNDFDRVDASNLPRQILFRPGDIDKSKAVAAAENLSAWNPQTSTQALDQRLDDDQLAAAIADCDVVLDCCDNFATRSRVNRACLAAKKPLVSGAAIRFEGQLAVFHHDQDGGPCYTCLYPEVNELLENCAGQGILGPVAGTIGSMMATETIKLLCGLPSDLSGRLWLYDGLAGSSRTFRIRRRLNCEACS